MVWPTLGLRTSKEQNNRTTLVILSDTAGRPTMQNVLGNHNKAVTFSRQCKVYVIGIELLF